MSKSPKTAARQSRREARTTARNQRRQQRQQEDRAAMEQRPEQPRSAVCEPLIALTARQADYGDAISSARIVLGIGPAGTGKTYYATRLAAQALERGEIQKIYLTRPAVEAGEKLGFLPGELDEKYEPYLRPFKDALLDHFGQGHMDYLLRKKVIEPVPLGYLRGSTIKNAWMLADEMQNATRNQMKMLLTRIGRDSTFIINGDPRQVDISPSDSGLADAADRLDGREDIEIIRFDRQDIVRDDIVQVVLEAYDN